MAAETVPPVGDAADEAAVAPRAQGFAAHLSWNVLSDLAARGASLWVSFFCAHVLAVADYGRFTWALAMAQTAWLAGDALLNSGYATRELARIAAAGRAPRGAGDLFWQARLSAGVLLSTVLAGAALVAPLPPVSRAALLASAAYGFAYAAFPDWALRAVSDFRTLLFANLAYALTLIVATLAWLPRHPSAAWAAGLWSTSFLAAAGVAVTALSRRGLLTARPALTLAAWTPHVRRSFVFSLGALAGIGSVQLPLLITGAVASAHEAGLFASAFRLILVPLGAFSVLWWPLFPLLVRRRPGDAAHRELVGRAAALAAAVAAPTGLMLGIFAEPLLAVLFGREYAAAAPALRAGAWALPAYVTCGLFEQVALASGGEALRLRVYGLASLVIATLAWTLVPAIGGAGAAIALASGFAAAALVWGVTLREHLPWRAMGRRLSPVLVASGVLAVAWLGLAHTPVPAPVSITLGGVAFAAVMLGGGWVELPGTGEAA